jgi:hypothetical protein
MSSDHRLFRAVNEHIRDMNSLDGDGSVDFLCECGRGDCVAVVPIGVEGFDEIAERRDRFIVAPDHLLPQVGRLVEARDGFAIVEPLSDS